MESPGRAFGAGPKIRGAGAHMKTNSSGGGFAKGPSSFGIHDSERVFELLDLKPGMRLMDLGCGPGDYALEAAARVGPAGRVYALDNWPEMARVTAEEARARGLGNILAMLADALVGIPLAGASVHVCLMATMLHQFSPERQLPRLMAEVSRILKPGGLAAVLNLKKEERPFGPSVEKSQSPGQIDGVMKPLGFAGFGLIDLGYSYLALYRR